MIANFDEVKKQLKELADIINTYKSESVQLRIVEIVLGTSFDYADEERETDADIQTPKRTAKRKRRAARPAVASPVEQTRKKNTSGSGAIATLNRVFEEGFFKQSRTIGDITKHCEVNLARKIKQPEISGKLARMVRTGELTRKKNSDGQYEYTNAKKSS